MEMLPVIANVLDTSIDSLLGYKSFVVSDYDKRYDTEDYYWGITPNNIKKRSWEATCKALLKKLTSYNNNI